MGFIRTNNDCGFNSVFRVFNMSRDIKRLWDLFSSKQKKKLVLLQVMVVAISVFEIVTIGMVAGFMSIISDTGKLEEYSYLFDILFSGKLTTQSILLYLSLLIVTCLTVSSLLSVIMTKKINRISLILGHDITLRLFKYYQSQDWLYYLNKNTSDLSNRVLIESGRLAIAILTPAVNLLSRLVFITLIGFAILYYDVKMTLMIMTFFICSYIIISLLLKNKLIRNSKNLVRANKYKSKVVKESFLNIKSSILLGKKDYFIKSFEVESLNYSESHASTMTISGAPKYLMEWLAYISMIMIIVLNLVINGDDFSSVLPLLTIYGLAAFKLLPSLQQVYHNLSTIKGNISVLHILYSDLKHGLDGAEPKESAESFHFKDVLEIEKGTFSYNNNSELALDSVSLKIRRLEKIGIVGHSGSGKSTLIDVLCGLIPLQEGSFKVDGNTINDNSSWSSNISYVPQLVTLLDASIAENIAFGMSYNDIDWEKLNQAIELSCLSELIERLPEGVNSQIGENGVQISGGQRQRISIARALYFESDIIVFDEATSALDGITESQIMESIQNLSGKKTIIMIAHRLKTIKSCDRIYFMDKGRVVDEGSYEYLLENNEKFKEMDKFS